MIDDRWSMERVWEHCERFAKLGIPLHWSEITVPSGTRKSDGWTVTLQTEQEQADYVGRLYTLLFSHPAVAGITWWNPVDGDWDTLPGGLIRSDLSPKPAYLRLLSLIKGHWWTDERLTTDLNGEVTVRAFHGEYRIAVGTEAESRERKVFVRPGQVQHITIRTP
jgi:hypothetical protein